MTLRLVQYLIFQLEKYGGISHDIAKPTAYVLFFSILLSAVYFVLQSGPKRRLPPAVKSKIPLVGNLIRLGENPIKFIEESKREYGSCFTVNMLGKKVCFVLGPEGNNFVFNAKIAYASAEEAYRNLTVPVFGSEVVYDVENAVLMEQKKFVKDALTVEAFKSYVPMIVEETEQYFEKRMGDKSVLTIDIARAMAELTIMTASRCLLGKEIRAQLDEKVAQLYWDLDGGFTPLNFIYPHLPIPSVRRRDRAQREMTELFLSIMKNRRSKNDYDNVDVLQTLMDAEYKDGKKMSDKAVAHLLIALLMGGQHTSSTTATWALHYLAVNPQVTEKIFEEQLRLLSRGGDEKMETDMSELCDSTLDDLPEMDYATVKQMRVLDYVVKETLRLRPPIVLIMRKVIQDMEFDGFDVPKGHYIAASPAVSQLDPKRYENPEKWDPFRFCDKKQPAEAPTEEWNINRLDVMEKSAKSFYLPFGAGRHRCIGEQFAYLQLKTILCVLLRRYKFSVPLDPKSGKPAEFPKRNFSTMVVMPEKPCELTLERIDASKLSLRDLCGLAM